MLLAPDTSQAKIFTEDIEPNLNEGDALFFGHGLNIHFGLIAACQRHRRHGQNRRPGHWSAASSSIGRVSRRSLVVHQDPTGQDRRFRAELRGHRRPSCRHVEDRLQEETETDLFGEQAVRRHGGAGARPAEVLVEAGTSRRWPTSRCLHELEAHRRPHVRGWYRAHELLGERHRGVRRVPRARVIDADTKKRMRRSCPTSRRHLRQAARRQRRGAATSSSRRRARRTLSTRSRSPARSCGPDELGRPAHHRDRLSSHQLTPNRLAQRCPVDSGSVISWDRTRPPRNPPTEIFSKEYHRDRGQPRNGHQRPRETVFLHRQLRERPLTMFGVSWFAPTTDVDHGLDRCSRPSSAGPGAQVDGEKRPEWVEKREDPTESRCPDGCQHVLAVRRRRRGRHHGADPRSSTSNCPAVSPVGPRWHHRSVHRSGGPLHRVQDAPRARVKNSTNRTKRIREQRSRFMSQVVKGVIARSEGRPGGDG